MNPIKLAVTNLANNKPVIYKGVKATIKVELINNTGSSIAISTSSSASITIDLPFFFSSSDIGGMSINLSNWTYSSNADALSLQLTYNGSDTYQWANGASIDFQITGVVSNFSPKPGQLQVNFKGMEGTNMPSQVETSLSIASAPQSGNASLTNVLQVTLDNQGSIYVSPGQDDPLNNSLFLNITNIGNAPLYNGKNLWSSTPQVTVAFIYGQTSGALAPDSHNTTPPTGSAWNIQGGVYVAQGNDWTITNPSNTGQAPSPQWTLQPSNTNIDIIGIGANASITFELKDIISITPPGSTQMIVQFSGFMKDASTHYNDQTYILDIVKQEPPPTRGVLNFFTESPIISVTSPTQEVKIPLRWMMFDVDSVTIIASNPSIPPQTKEYSSPPPIINYDKETVSFSNVTESTSIIITIQAYSGSKGFLNSVQFAVYLQANFFIDPRDNQVYPAVRINSQLWMAQNLNYDNPNNDWKYANNDPSNTRQYQSKDSSAPSNAGGWRLPNKQDWQTLFKKPYGDLISGGSTGFDVALNGYVDSNDNVSSYDKYGYYWTGDIHSTQADYAYFSSESKTDGVVDSPNGFPLDYYLSVRFVRDII